MGPYIFFSSVLKKKSPSTPSFVLSGPELPWLRIVLPGGPNKLIPVPGHDPLAFGPYIFFSSVLKKKSPSTPSFVLSGPELPWLRIVLPSSPSKLTPAGQVPFFGPNIVLVSVLKKKSPSLPFAANGSAFPLRIVLPSSPFKVTPVGHVPFALGPYIFFSSVLKKKSPSTPSFVLSGPELP